jgi:hypothetical protein
MGVMAPFCCYLPPPRVGRPSPLTGPLAWSIWVARPGQPQWRMSSDLARAPAWEWRP